MKELIKRVFKDQKKRRRNQYHLLRGAVRLPLPTGAVRCGDAQLLRKYGEGGGPIPQNGVGFRDKKQAEQLADKLNNQLKADVKQWN